MPSPKVHNAVFVHPLNYQVSGIFGFRQLGRNGSRRRTPKGARRLHPERLMRTLLVVLLSEPIDQLFALVQWVHFLPGHGAVPPTPKRCPSRVTHVPGLMCYLCARSVQTGEIAC